MIKATAEQIAQNIVAQWLTAYVPEAQPQFRFEQSEHLQQLIVAALNVAPTGSWDKRDRTADPDDIADCYQRSPSAVPVARGRTAKDYAIEFGGYLAAAAERFLERYGASPRVSDADDVRAVRSAIYEFRKRALAATDTPHD